MSKVKIAISFYDDEQKKLIEKNFPEDYKLISKVEGKTIEVPYEDFKTYSYFRHQYDSPGLKTFIDLSKLASSWAEYELYFHLDSSTGKLTNIYPGPIESTNIGDALGVAGGLAVAGAIYGLTQADWINIGKQNHKDFDFHHTSSIDGRFINIEAKGCVNNDNSSKTPSVSQHKKKIFDKKNDDKFKAKYSYKKDSCIGIITVADRANKLQAWIVDPEVPNQEMNPEKYRLLSRLYFYFSIFRLISKRSYLTLTLANRISVLESLSNPREIDGIPLINFNFDKIRITDSFLFSRARNDNNSVIGRTVLVRNQLLFIGIDTEIIDRIIPQKIDDILDLKLNPKTTYEKIVGRIRKTDESYQQLKILPKIEIHEDSDENFIIFSAEMQVIRSSSGLCMARLTKTNTNSPENIL